MKRKTYLRIALAAVASVAVLGPDFALGQGEQSFTGASDSSYTNDLNWVGNSGMLVPEGQFEEFAAIGSNTPDPVSTNTFPVVSADLTGIAPSVGRVLIGFGGGTDGTVNVSGSGSLTAGATTGGLAGDIVVGANGTGTLNVSTTGTVVADLLDIRGTGTTRITGPSATLNAGDLNVNGTLIADITSPTAHSKISAVGGTANIGGSLSVDLSSIASPATGTTWEILEADTVAGTFSSVNLIGSTTLGTGQALNARNVDNGSTTSVELFVEQLLTLQVNRTSGEFTILNSGAAIPANAIDLDGYTVSSASGSLNTGWNSLEDQGSLGDWRESNPTTERLSELKESGSTTVAGGGSLTLTNGFSSPTEFGAGEDLEFAYTRLDGTNSIGLVKYTGDANTLVLQIDPTSGAAKLINESQFSVDIDGYTITSGDDALLTDWNSLDDQNAGGGDWRESNATIDRLSELKEAGALTLTNGTTFDLGDLYNTGVGSGDGDVVFEFLINDGLGGESIASLGEVRFAEFATLLLGDADNDLAVAGSDLLAVTNNFGNTGPADGLLLGDADDDGAVAGSDLLAVTNNFGNTLPGSGSLTATSAVPEPSTVMILLTLLGIVLVGRPVVAR
ncbi:MAG: hypothetical protein ACR2NM_17365 [Bythopirellula sp.]